MKVRRYGRSGGHQGRHHQPHQWEHLLQHLGPLHLRAGSGAAEYYLTIGTSLGARDVYNTSQGMALSNTVSGLPGGGIPLYVRLWTRFGTVWQWTDYTFTAAP